MTHSVQNSTALLATAFGLLLSRAEGLGQGNPTLDVKTARELAVISRVLEKRLSDMRTHLAHPTPPAYSDEIPCGRAEPVAGAHAS